MKKGQDDISGDPKIVKEKDVNKRGILAKVSKCSMIINRVGL